MNFEIIPNWHPVFVHFTIGLLGISVLFYMAGLVTKKDVFYTVGKWNLWVGVAITIGTVLAGLQAAGTVDHDAESHAAMMDHRSWALTTAGVFGALGLWSFLKHQRSTPTALFTIVLFLASSMIAITGFKGAELVYRHGTGVMSLPDTGTHDHSAHAHGSETEDMTDMLHHEEEANETETVGDHNDSVDIEHDHSSHPH